VVPFTFVAFWLRYLPRHDWWGTGLHVALIIIAVGFGVHSYRLAVQTLSGAGEPSAPEPSYRLAVQTLSGAGEPSAPEPDQPLWTWIWGGIRSYRPDRWTILALALALVLSVGATIDPGENLLTMLGYETYAELEDEDISAKPSGWTGLEETAAVEIAQVKGADLEGRNLRAADASGAFLVKAKLARADLRDALLWQADLRGADLRDADLRDANLGDADLRGADLLGADLTSADLLGADLTSADLTGTDFYGLTQAQLDGACGDDKTKLPQGLTIRTCPVAAPPASPSPPPGSS
jgi:Pentapeptide repeats (8 copies)